MTDPTTGAPEPPGWPPAPALGMFVRAATDGGPATQAGPAFDADD